MSKVSVIVPCYNSGSFLKATIDSILNQDFINWELILIDDGSLDNTWDIIEIYIKLDSRIKGFRKENQGTTKTRNYGFQKANAAALYIFFLDHDDQLISNALFKLCEYMDSHLEVGLLACQFYDVTVEGKRLESGKRSRWVPGLLFPKELKDDELETPFVTFFCATGQGPFAIYRKSVYIQTDGWETDFWPHEDTDMFCQMSLISKVHFLPDRMYLKRIHPAQGMNNPDKVWKAYKAFRMKWDNRQPKTMLEKKTLINAKRYYYTVHSPFRDLKVAEKAFREILNKPSIEKIKWLLKLIKSAAVGMTINRFKKYS